MHSKKKGKKKLLWSHHMYFNPSLWGSIKRNGCHVLTWCKVLVRLQLSRPGNYKNWNVIITAISEMCHLNLNQCCSVDDLIVNSFHPTSEHTGLHFWPVTVTVPAEALTAKRYKMHHVLKGRLCCVVKLTPPPLRWPCTECQWENNTTGPVTLLEELLDLQHWYLLLLICHLSTRLYRLQLYTNVKTHLISNVCFSDNLYES